MLTDSAIMAGHCSDRWLADLSAGSDAAGAVVLGVSPDEPKKLRHFADKYGHVLTKTHDDEVLAALGRLTAR